MLIYPLRNSGELRIELGDQKVSVFVEAIGDDSVLLSAEVPSMSKVVVANEGIACDDPEGQLGECLQQLRKACVDLVAAELRKSIIETFIEPQKTSRKKKCDNRGVGQQNQRILVQSYSHRAGRNSSASF